MSTSPQSPLLPTSAEDQINELHHGPTYVIHVENSPGVAVVVGTESATRKSPLAWLIKFFVVGSVLLSALPSLAGNGDSEPPATRPANAPHILLGREKCIGPNVIDPDSLWVEQGINRQILEGFWKQLEKLDAKTQAEQLAQIRLQTGSLPKEGVELLKKDSDVAEAYKEVFESMDKGQLTKEQLSKRTGRTAKLLAKELDFPIPRGAKRTYAVFPVTPARLEAEGLINHVRPKVTAEEFYIRVGRQTTIDGVFRSLGEIFREGELDRIEEASRLIERGK